VHRENRGGGHDAVERRSEAIWLIMLLAGGGPCCGSRPPEVGPPEQTCRLGRATTVDSLGRGGGDLLLSRGKAGRPYSLHIDDGLAWDAPPRGDRGGRGLEGAFFGVAAVPLEESFIALADRPELLQNGGPRRVTAMVVPLCPQTRRRLADDSRCGGMGVKSR